MDIRIEPSAEDAVFGFSAFIGSARDVIIAWKASVIRWAWGIISTGIN